MITLPETALMQIARGSNTKSTQDMTCEDDADWSLYTTRFIGTPLCGPGSSLGIGGRPPSPSNETSFILPSYSPREEMQRRLTAILKRSVPQMDLDDI